MMTKLPGPLLVLCFLLSSASAQPKAVAAADDYNQIFKALKWRSIGPFRGDLDWPVTGSLRQAFGNSRGGVVSNGVDIASPEGTPARAVHVMHRKGSL